MLNARSDKRTPKTTGCDGSSTSAGRDAQKMILRGTIINRVTRAATGECNKTLKVPQAHKANVTTKSKKPIPNLHAYDATATQTTQTAT